MLDVATIRQANSLDDFEVAKVLIEEYSVGLAVNLCFQGLDAEIAALHQAYAPPRGVLLLAESSGAAVGCVAYRALDERTCEMKRLYLRPRARGTGLGRRMCVALMEAARAAGYKRMVLDTLPEMEAARALYSALGFKSTEPYYRNPIEGVVYLSVDL